MRKLTNKEIKVLILGIVLTIVGLFIIGGIYYYFNNKNINKLLTDNKESALRFKKEYESLNGITLESLKIPFLDMQIPDENAMVYSSIEEIMDVLDKGTGIIYFGFPECPWCRSAVPVLIDAVKEAGASKIYYYNAYPIRDVKHLDDKGNIVIDKEGTKEYYTLISKLAPVLKPYEGLNNEQIKRLYLPTVLFVKDGKIVKMHEGTVESQTDPNIKLTEDQRKELKEIYKDGINKTILCKGAC
ncbi:MAG: hypothetical protein RSB45_03775 [Bacilli bacterium]